MTVVEMALIMCNWQVCENIGNNMLRKCSPVREVTLKEMVEEIRTVSHSQGIIYNCKIVPVSKK